MASDVPRLRYLKQKYGARTYYVLMKTLQTTLACEASDVAKYRYHVLLHFYTYGTASTLDAFKITRPTLYRWKRTYETNGKKSWETHSSFDSATACSFDAYGLAVN